MRYRLLSVILVIVLMVLAACRQTEPFTEEELGGNLDAINNITYIITVDQFWITPNPGGRWSYVGRQLQVTSNLTTVIQIRLEAKESVDQPFEEALTNITADSYTIETLDDGRLYARGTSVVSDHVIWRDHPEFVVEIMLFDSLTDTINQQYINDWEIVALDGGLFFAD